MPNLEQIPLKAWQQLLAKVPAGGRILSWLVHLDGFIRNIVERDPFIFSNGSRVVVTDASGELAESGITTTELGYLDNATSNIQNQFNTLNGIVYSFDAVSTTANISARTTTADATGGAFSVTLPAAASYEGIAFQVKKIDSSTNAVTVDGNGAETIDGQATQDLLSQYDCLDVVSDGTNWVVT